VHGQHERPGETKNANLSGRLEVDAEAVAVSQKINAAKSGMARAAAASGRDEGVSEMGSEPLHCGLCLHKPWATGIYGTLGVASSSNVPGARYGAESWTDSTGNLWLFGGTGEAASSTIGGLSGLWEYTP
jgi:hypothetical protein